MKYRYVGELYTSSLFEICRALVLGEEFLLCSVDTDFYASR